MFIYCAQQDVQFDDMTYILVVLLFNLSELCKRVM